MKKFDLRYISLALLDLNNTILALGIIFISAYFKNYWLLFLFFLVTTPKWIKERLK